jgi:hypothetical protein
MYAKCFPAVNFFAFAVTLVDVDFPPSNSSPQLDISSFGAGQYFLVLMTESGEFYYDKLVVIRN